MLLVLLSLSWVGGLAAVPTEAAESQTVVGKLAERAGRKEVTGTLPRGNPQQLREQNEVIELMDVGTGEQSGAKISVGQRQGSVTLGPESHVIFERAVVDLANGVMSELNLNILLGKLRFAFMPGWLKGRDTVLGAALHEIRIETPSSVIQMYGTDVYVSVEGGTTDVFVAEGVVTVESKAGGMVRVAAGNWTQVKEGQRPTLPAPLDPNTGTMSPQVRFLPATYIDPPLIDPSDPRLNLPK